MIGPLSNHDSTCPVAALIMRPKTHPPCEAVCTCDSKFSVDPFREKTDWATLQREAAKIKYVFTRKA